MITAIHVSTSGESRNPIGSVAPLDMLIAVGFGGAGIFCDGHQVADGEVCSGALTVRVAEMMAANAGWGTWEIRMHAPLWGATWRREAPERWVCVAADRGFV